MLPPEMLEIVRRMIAEMRLSYRAAEGHLHRMLASLGMKVLNHTTIWKRLGAERAAPSVPPRRGFYTEQSFNPVKREVEKLSGVKFQLKDMRSTLTTTIVRGDRS